MCTSSFNLISFHCPRTATHIDPLDPGLGGRCAIPISISTCYLTIPSLKRMKILNDDDDGGNAAMLFCICIPLLLLNAAAAAAAAMSITSIRLQRLTD